MESNCIKEDIIIRSDDKANGISRISHLKGERI